MAEATVRKELIRMTVALVAFGVLLVVASVIFAYTYTTRENAYRRGKVEGQQEGYARAQAEVRKAVTGNGVLLLRGEDGKEERFIAVWWKDTEIQEVLKEKKRERRTKGNKPAR